jgi:hypothetical protein
VGKLFIRNAEPFDWLPVCELMKRIHAESPYSDVEYNEADGKRMFKISCLSQRHLSLVVADKKFKVYGVCVGVIQKNWWGAKTAIELITYTDQPGYQARLLKRYKKWAIDAGAVMVSVVNSYGENEPYDKLIKAIGFNKVGSVHLARPEGN